MNKRLSSFFGLGSGTGNSNNLVSRSTKAVCGAFEREITVRADQVASTKAKLRAKGMMIVGTSEPIGNTRKIWFVARGVAAL